MRTVSADDGDVLRLARQRATADRATARSKALGQQKRSASLTDLVGLNQSNAPEDSDTEPLSRTCDVSDVQTQDGRLSTSLKGTSLRRLSTYRDPSAWTDQELIGIADRMQRGLEIKDRNKGFKRYGACFLGTDAVAWMLRHGLAANSESAERLGNDLLRMGLLFEVSYKHPFRDKPYLYRFHEAGSSSASDDDTTEPLTESVRNESLYDMLWTRRNVASSDGSVRGKKAPGDRWKPAAEVTRLQRRLADQTAQLAEFREISGVMFDGTSRQLRTVGNLLKQHHEQLQQVATAQEACQKELQASSQRQDQAAALLALVAIINLAQTSGPWALTVSALLLLAAWKLDCPPWKWFRRRRGPPHKKQQASRQYDELPVDIANPFSASLSAPAAVSVQGSMDGDSAASSPENNRRPESWAEAAPPARTEFEGWQDAPMLLRPRLLPNQVVQGMNNGRIPVNTTESIQFETDLFKGSAVIFVAGLQSAPRGLFAGQRRRTAVTIQGRFKQELGFDDIITGQEFSRPAKNLPAKWLVETVLISLARKISPSMVIGPLSAPHVLVPLVAFAQEINVAPEGQEPDPAGNVHEDMRAAFPDLVDKYGGPMSGPSRKQHFTSGARRQGKSFDTSHVWTFTMYQHFVDMSTYELNMVRRFDLAGHLDGQPLQFMMKHRSTGQYLFNFEAWHEKLLPAARQ